MKAVFVFCEGTHDVTFTARSLGQVANASWLGDAIGKLPSPLGPIPDPANPSKPKLESLIARRYSNRTLDQLKLQAAAHAPLPAFEAIVRVGDTLFVLVRCQGDGAATAAMELLGDVNALLNPAFGTDVKQIAAAFLFDADTSVQHREASFAAEYSALLAGQAAPSHSTWSGGANRVGLYVFHDAVSNAGTLEELIAPLVAAEWGPRWVAADAFLTQHAQPGDAVSSKRSEWLKAQINVTGQFLFPGDPMSVVIGKPRPNRAGLSNNHFAGTQSNALVNFLLNVPW